MSENSSVQTRVAYVACLGVIGIVSFEFGVVGVLPQIANYYQISVEKAGMLLSAFALTVAITGPFTVLALSKYNKKKIMALASALFFMAAIASFFKPPFWALLLLRVFPALLHPIFFASAIEGVSEGVSRKTQLRLTSIVIGGNAISQVTIIPLSTYLASKWGWEAIYAIQVVINLLSLVGILLFMPNIINSAPKSFKGQLGILKRPSFIASTCINMFVIMSWFATYSYFADFLMKTKYFSEEQVSYLLLIFGVFGVVSNFIAGHWMGKKLVVTTVFYLTGPLVLPFLFQFTGEGFLGNAIIVAIWGIMYGPCFLIGISYMIADAQDAKGFANSLQSSTGNLGVSIGTAVAGFFIASHTVAITPWVGLGFGILTVAAFLWRIQLHKKGQVI